MTRRWLRLKRQKSRHRKKPHVSKQRQLHKFKKLKKPLNEPLQKQRHERRKKQPVGKQSKSLKTPSDRLSRNLKTPSDRLSRKLKTPSDRLNKNSLPLKKQPNKHKRRLRGKKPLESKLKPNLMKRGALQRLNLKMPNVRLKRNLNRQNEKLKLNA